MIFNNPEQFTARIEFRYPIKSGGWLNLEATANIVDDKKLIFVIKDISDRKKAEEEIEQHIEKLEKLNKAMTGREMRIIELKDQVNKLSKEIGKAPPRRTKISWQTLRSRQAPRGDDEAKPRSLPRAWIREERKKGNLFPFFRDERIHLQLSKDNSRTQKTDTTK